MKALVTGAGGFLGKYICQQLVARGSQVRGLCRGDYPELERRGVEIVRADVRDAAAVRAACRDIDTVFHVAAVAGIWGPWEHYYGINTQGTLNVVVACRAQNVGRLVFTSSPSVTFDGSAQEGIDETAPYPSRWLCHYSHTKALAEQAVLAANGPSLATCALRPHLVWGPGDPHLVPRLIERARSGQLRRVGDGTNRIDIVFVENAAAAHLQVADALRAGSAVAGRAYFISQGEPVNCWNWIDSLLALADLPPVKKSISLPAAWAAGALLETVYKALGRQSEPRMTRFLAAQLGKSHYFDISRSRHDFGYHPVVSTAEGMERLARELRDTYNKSQR